MIIQGMNVSNPAMIVGGMVAIAVVAWLTTLLVAGLERLVCPYKREIEGL